MSPCRFCGQLTDNGLTVVATEACDQHWDNPERSIDILRECAAALEILAGAPTSAYAMGLAQRALGRWRADRYVPPVILE
jgi:hypothetical protein